MKDLAVRLVYVQQYEQNMKNRLIFALIASVILSGCLVPERFKAAASFESNGSYSYSYEGTAVHGFAAMQLAKTGTLSRKEIGRAHV